MPVNAEAVGKQYAPVLYAVGREKIREYAAATGETSPLCLDLDAARAAGYADVVAPPMFVVVYCGAGARAGHPRPRRGDQLRDHGARGQEFVWGPPVVAGDEITTTASVKEISERGGMGFYVFESVSQNQGGETVCTATWTNIVRGV